MLWNNYAQFSPNYPFTQMLYIFILTDLEIDMLISKDSKEILQAATPLSERDRTFLNNFT